MPRPLKWGILGASTIILSKDMDKYVFMFGSNFYETDITYIVWKYDKSPKVKHSKFCTTKVLYSFAPNSSSGSSNQ